MSETFYSPARCVAIRNRAFDLKMSAPDSYWQASKDELAKVFNGCGPDSWTDAFRRCASWVYRNFPEAISIHDWEFEHSDGETATLVFVNKEFRTNCKAKLDSICPLSWNPFKSAIRAREWCKVQFAFVALKNGSEKAWKEAHERLS